MRFQIEELRQADGVGPYLQWVEPAVGEIYPQERGPESGSSARNFLVKSLGQKESVYLLGREEKTGKFAGFLFIARREDSFLATSSPFAYLLFTHPDFRRLGLAASLLVEGEKVLKERGLTKLIAPATHNDDAIISMGERRGYLREREYMVKEL